MGQSQSMENTGNEKEQLSLLLMGKTGHGKSSLGNSLLGCDAFKVSSDINSQTAEVAFAYSDFESISIKVVDGPGLRDTELSKLEDRERAVRNLSAALMACSEGVDAFLFVFRFGVRFTPEEVSVLKTLKIIFGQDYLKHAIVVLTYGDQFEEEITFDDWCKKQTGQFRELYSACDGRFLLFNNKERDEEKQIAQREKLTQLVKRLKSRHGGYTADCFKLAESLRQEMIIKFKRPILKERIQKQTGILFSKIEKYRKQISADQNAEIKTAICKLKKEIQTEDKGSGLLKDLMKTVDDVEKHLHDTVELRKLAERLENIRKAAMIWRQIHDQLDCTGPMGTKIMEYLEEIKKITVTKMFDIQSNMLTLDLASD